MPNYKPTDYNQDLLLTINLEKQIVPGSLEWAIHTVVEERIDMSLFDAEYKNDAVGRKAYNPRTLLKIVLVGYSRGILSSRRLEQACRENITFMALCCGYQPDHSTIANFVSSMGEKARALFVQVLMVCEEEGLLAGTHLSIDGTKLSSNASKEWSGTWKTYRQKRDVLQERIQELQEEHVMADRTDRAGVDELKQKMESLQAAADKIDAFLKKNDRRIGDSGKEIQSNMTDNESAKMSTSHGVLQGYNANAVVDEENQVIVAAEAIGRGTDHSNLPTLLALTGENLTAIGRCKPLHDIIITADTSYFSEVNLAACDRHYVDAFIPDPHFRKRREEERMRRRNTDPKQVPHRSTKTLLKPLKTKPDKKFFSTDDFTYDPHTNRLRCPAGKHLYSNGTGIVKGRRRQAFRAPINACANCHLRSKCLRKPTTQTRQVTLSHEHIPASQQKNPTRSHIMREKIDKPHAQRIYSRRIGIVEPPFANICTHKGMRQFHLRGKNKVDIQWNLYCIVHNLGKVARTH